MRTIILAAAAAITLGGLAAVPAEAQPYWHHRYHHDHWRHGWERGRHYGWYNRHRRPFCHWTWRYHHRARVCWR